MRYRTKHVAEYAALRLCGGVLTVLPYPVALGVAWILARLLFHVVRFRRREVVARIRAVFGADTPRRVVHRIAWESLRNTAFNAIDMLRLSHFTLGWMERHTTLPDALRKVKTQTDTGRGCVIATAHMGSWELTGVATHLLGIPVFTFYARQRNPLVNRYLATLRHGPGIQAFERGNVNLRTIIQRLKAGQALAILPDIRKSSEGLRVPFLGGEANVGEGMALFARQTRVPIFPCIATRRGWRRHDMVMHEPVWPDESLPKEEDVVRMTRHVLNIIDEAIHRDPGQWFWYNRRWILDPPGTPLDRKR